MTSLDQQLLGGWEDNDTPQCMADGIGTRYGERRKGSFMIRLVAPCPSNT